MHRILVLCVQTLLFAINITSNASYRASRILYTFTLPLLSIPLFYTVSFLLFIMNADPFIFHVFLLISS
jgi:hypothetical protein